MKSFCAAINQQTCPRLLLSGNTLQIFTVDVHISLTYALFSHNTSLLLFYVKKMQVLWFLQLMAAYMRLQWEMEHK